MYFAAKVGHLIAMLDLLVMMQKHRVSRVDILTMIKTHMDWLKVSGDEIQKE